MENEIVCRDLRFIYEKLFLVDELQLKDYPAIRNGSTLRLVSKTPGSIDIYVKSHLSGLTIALELPNLDVTVAKAKEMSMHQLDITISPNEVCLILGIKQLADEMSLFSYSSVGLQSGSIVQLEYSPKGGGDSRQSNVNRDPSATFLSGDDCVVDPSMIELAEGLECLELSTYKTLGNVQVHPCGVSKVQI